MTISMNYEEHYACIYPTKYYQKILDGNEDLVDGKTRKTPSKADFFIRDPNSPILKDAMKNRMETIIYQLRYACTMAPETTFICCDHEFLDKE